MRSFDFQLTIEDLIVILQFIDALLVPFQQLIELTLCSPLGEPTALSPSHLSFLILQFLSLTNQFRTFGLQFLFLRKGLLGGEVFGSVNETENQIMRKVHETYTAVECQKDPTDETDGYEDI